MMAFYVARVAPMGETNSFYQDSPGWRMNGYGIGWVGLAGRRHAWHGTKRMEWIGCIGSTGCAGSTGWGLIMVAVGPGE